MATCAGSTALKEIPFELIFNFTSFTNGDVTSIIPLSTSDLPSL